MSKVFHARATQSERGTDLALRGSITEQAGFELEQAFQELRGRVRIDFAGVDRINSVGLGILMRLLDVASRQHEIEYVACSEVIVDHFQMLDFSRYGRITSFYSRYLCSRCRRHESKLLAVDALQIRNDRVEAPTYGCNCGGTLRVDEALDFVIEHVRR